MSALPEKPHKPHSLEHNHFDWSDPLLLAQELSDDERMVSDSARAYCQEKLLPRVRDGFRNETFDRAIMTEMGEMGFLGPTIPEEYGGAGLGAVNTNIDNGVGNHGGSTVLGWQALGGVDYRVSDQASIFAEYRYQNAHDVNAGGLTGVSNTSNNLSFGVKWRL